MFSFEKKKKIKKEKLPKTKQRYAAMSSLDKYNIKYIIKQASITFRFFFFYLPCCVARLHNSGYDFTQFHTIMSVGRNKAITTYLARFYDCTNVQS